jgi:uncharacterized protein YkwD
MKALRGGSRQRLMRRIALTALVVIFAAGISACLPAAEPTTPDPVAGSVLAAMNRDRAANGLAALEWNGRLGGLGSTWAAHLAVAKVGLVHQDLTAVLYGAGYEDYNRLGENLLVGPTTMRADSMETAWMNSPAHRANILRSSFTWAGVASRSSDGKVWVVVEFGG